ncbi:MAG TPA: hypothetical protein PLW83_07290 [Deltaproteobacteria bacterium]|nr:hypothetical protein [Deltaproteobacteria bacterium]
MIVSEDELYETQCPVPLWKCDKCNTTLSLSTKCDCKRWKSRMNDRSKKLLRLMRGMSEERPLGFDEIAKACGLPRMSVKSFLSRQACKPKVDWKGMEIAFIRTSGGYQLSRRLTEDERKFEALRVILHQLLHGRHVRHGDACDVRKASGMMRFDTEEDGEADAVDYVFWILAWPRILAMIIAAIYRRF